MSENKMTTSEMIDILQDSPEEFGIPILPSSGGLNYRQLDWEAYLAKEAPAAFLKYYRINIKNTPEPEPEPELVPPKEPVKLSPPTPAAPGKFLMVLELDKLRDREAHKQLQARVVQQPRFSAAVSGMLAILGEFT